MNASRIPDHLIDDFEDSMTRLARLMATRHVGPECCPGSLTLSQMMLLRALETGDPLNISDIAALLAVKAPAASAVVDGLVRHEYAERVQAADDRRVTFVHLTDEGRSVLSNAEKTRRTFMRRYLELLSEDDVRTLIRVHRTLIDAIDSGAV